MYFVTCCLIWCIDPSCLSHSSSQIPERTTESGQIGEIQIKCAAKRDLVRCLVLYDEARRRIVLVLVIDAELVFYSPGIDF